MGTTTFSGPVRSEGGFQSITKNATTGAITSQMEMGTGTALMSAGAGITDGTGTVLNVSVTATGSMITTEIYIDVTGLDSVATIGDIVGTGASAAYIGQVTTAINGTIVAGKVECFEAPLTGDPDINIYSAVEATGVLGGAIGDLDETLLANTGDHTITSSTRFALMPAADEYIYLVVGAATAATYTAGKLLITLYGTSA